MAVGRIAPLFLFAFFPNDNEFIYAPHTLAFLAVAGSLRKVTKFM